MIYYEVKINYQRQTGEDNPGKVNETYLVEGISMTDVENRLMTEIQSQIFGGESEIQGCKKVQYYDTFLNPDADYWYKGRVELITIDNDKETRKKVSMLVQAHSVLDAVKTLREKLNQLDCEIVSVAKTQIVDFLRATD